MNFWHWLTGKTNEVQQETFNPATGLPMVTQDCTGLDIAGNPYGTNIQHYGSSQPLGNDNFGSWYEG